MLNTGQSVNLSPVVQSALPVSYQWRKDRVFILGQTGASLELMNLGRRDAGLYSIAVSSSAGVLVQDVAQLSVRSPKRLNSLTFLDAENVRIWFGDADGAGNWSGNVQAFEAEVRNALDEAWSPASVQLQVADGQVYFEDSRNWRVQRFYRIMER